MYRKFLSLIFLFSLVFSACKKDDNYTPLAISAEDDFADILQNESVDIYILNNDDNLPDSGSLSVTTSEAGQNRDY